MQQLLLTARRLSNDQGINEPVAATGADVAAALPHLSTDKLRTILLIAWYSAQRPADILRLKKDDITFKADRSVVIRFARSKVTNHIGTFHIHTRIPQVADFKIVKDYCDAAPTGFLFPYHNKYQRDRAVASIREALRKVRKELEIRSLRRGTLQTLAAGGASEAELLEFSRHSSVRMLRQYLAFGAVPQAEQRRAMDRSNVLDTSLMGGAPQPTLTGGFSHSDSLRINDFLSLGADGEVHLSSEHAPPAINPPCDPDEMPIHAKAVTTEPMDLAVINEFAKRCPRHLQDRWAEQSQWLSDMTGLHSAVPFRGRRILRAKLRPGDIGRLLDIRNIAEVPAAELHRVKGTIRVFTVPEHAKKRRRCIKHTKAFNDYYGPETVVDPENDTRRSARQAILDAPGACTFDFAAMFDQIPLHESASFCQAFSAEGRVWRNLRCPMGGRHSTTIASTISRVLLSFPMHDSVLVSVATDNVRFAGPREHACAAAFEFIKRCKKARAKLNEIDVDKATLEDVFTHWRAEDVDFLGEVADYANKTIRCRERHVSRLDDYTRAASDASASFATQFGLYAMLLYMSDTLGIRLDKFLPTRLHFSELARALAKDPTKWRTASGVPLPDDIFPWIEEARSNRPAKLVRLQPPQTVIIGDASRYGFAGIICRRRPDDAWATSLIQRRWDHKSRRHINFRRSAKSEPEAAVRLLRLARLDPNASVAYVTDHLPFAEAHTRGHSASPFYNRRVSSLRDHHPNAFLAHVPGQSTPADIFSRFKLSKLDRDRATAAAAIAERTFRSADRGYCIVGSMGVARLELGHWDATQ